MPSKKTARNERNGRLEEALATLITNQAHFIGGLDRAEERFNEIKAILLDQQRILKDHQRLLLDHQSKLDGLSEAVRQKIGFKTR